MPLYSIDSRSRSLKHKFERRPKISIVTDIADVRSIPREIRGIVLDERRIVRDFPSWSKSNDGADACLVWFSGDRLLEGNARDLLKSLHSGNRRSFVVVNTPCVEEVPFLTIQPRIFTKPASVDRRSFQFRLESGGAPVVRMMMGDSNWPDEPWAKLVEAVSSERVTPGAGIEPLVGLWEARNKITDIIGALVVRNLVAAMLRQREGEKARKFLEAGAKLYATYAELHYLAALLAIRELQFRDALPHLERAKACGSVFPGSGGENSYRCDWLLGTVAARVGNDRVAFQHFIGGVQRNPLFAPSLTQLLKLQLPRRIIDKHRYVFVRAALTNPQFAPRILEYLSAHHVSDAAQRILYAAQGDSAKSENARNQTATATEPLPAEARSAVDQNRHADSKQTAGIAFEGVFFEHSSIARINREIAGALLSSHQFDVRLETSTPGVHPPQLFPNGEVLIQSAQKQLHPTNLTIRHQWPPNFRRPPTGKLAIILPWEYGGVPRVWIDQIHQNVDELWVPSNFIREIFVRNGVDAARVTVIPNGFDPKVFRPEGPSFDPQGGREFVFLFVGGAIRRKGIDLLLDAYKAAFDPSESVTLLLVVSGSTGAYQHNSLIAEVRAATADPKQPPIMPIFEAVEDCILANLYRRADAFVLPYRGEGFGLPLLEAMACGTPVVTTAEGPAKEFCNESNSYLVPAATELVLDPPPPLGRMAGSFTWFEPDFVELTKTLRHVHENRQEVAAKGRAAARAIRHLTWQNAAEQYCARIRRLCNM